MRRHAPALICLILLVLTASWLFRQWAPVSAGKGARVPAHHPAPMVPALGLRG